MPHEPKKKHSKSAKRIRRASISLASVNLVLCAKCQQKTLAHMACRNCGFYGAKEVRGAKETVKVTRV